MSTHQWIFLLLLVLSICINYIDRGSLSVAGPIMIKDLNLDPYQFGILGSAFFWTYAPMQIVSGWLVDRFNVNWVYSAGFFAWSVATLLTGGVRSFTMLLILRTILGMGESVAYPSYSKILVANFKEHQRGIANGFIDSGSKFGPALGVLLGGLFMANYGWHVFFYTMGAASLLWLIPWFFYAPRDKIAEKVDMTNAPSMLRILTLRSAWGTFIGLFCSNYVWYFILTWLPYYMKNERHYSMQDLALYGSLPYWVVGIGSGVAGFLSDRQISSGGAPIQVRKTLIACGLVLTTVILPSVMVQSRPLSLALLMLGCFGFGLCTGSQWALTQSLAGPLASGKWTGLTNAIGNVSGVVAPWFTGWVVQTTGQFYYAFLVCAVFCLISASGWFFVVERKQPVDWALTDLH